MNFFILTALRDEILELGCKNRDLEFVKLMMKKFDCDPESKLNYQSMNFMTL